MFRTLPFPFDGHRFPDALGAVVQRTVLDGTEPAREVVHFSDGSWAIGDGVSDPNLPGAAVATHIWHAIAQNSSIAGLAQMPPGSLARRPGPGEPWQVTALAEDDD
ncbi:hypothetical protein CXY01_09780 [Cellulomonas xylanilytica]|uniref:Uncharacterized protein n=2 Tax=Cellulomonas xylanilytica TaxID=233583 RepID=A0A510V0M0_9CELL|nr:hypothetical protein CXY01_09780 [Cellulomonas xylanilytica]